MWELDFGHQLEKWQANEQAGKKSPLDYRPQLPLHLRPTFEAFWELHGSRPITMGGPSPIPMTEVQAYCNLNDVWWVPERADFLYLIRAMDGAYLAHHQRKNPKPPAK